ncbi:MAG: hypothetical protein Q9201_003023 [Fulgogasparrea decipioides]
MPPSVPGRQGIIRTGSRILEWNNRRAGEYAKARYGTFRGAILTCFTEATVERLMRLEEDIINGQDEDLIGFKTSLASELSMIAVAGAILAQIAITALALQDIEDVHWIVRGFFACGLAMGLLSVTFAVMQQRTMGNLHKASSIRAWLLANSCNNPVTNSRDEKHNGSFTVAFLTQIPYTMIEYGSVLLIVGLGLYFGYAWKRNLDTESGAEDNRNVFIMYIACTAFMVVQWAFAYFSKSIWRE